MATRTARNILAFLRCNIEGEVETIHEARQFVRSLDGLTDDERLYLECALKDRKSILEFSSIPFKR